MQPTSTTEILTIALMHEPAPERVSRFKIILRPHFIDPEIETKDLSAMERCVRMALHIREGIRMVETQYGRLVLTSNAKLQGEKITKVFRQFVADLLCWYLTFSIEDRRLQGVLVEYIAKAAESTDQELSDWVSEIPTREQDLASIYSQAIDGTPFEIHQLCKIISEVLLFERTQWSSESHFNPYQDPNFMAEYARQPESLINSVDAVTNAVTSIMSPIVMAGYLAALSINEEGDSEV